MLVIVPDDLAAMRDRLSQELLDDIDTTVESGPYELLLPKWETESNLDLLPGSPISALRPATIPPWTPFSMVRYTLP
ncbi:MAG: hypothetical protein R2710_06850 [Acidimicrobiales bacterium]